MFGAVTLLLIEKATRTKKLSWSLLAGGALGLMFLEQQDVALFVGVFLGFYAILAGLREDLRDLKGLTLRLASMALVALLIGGPGSLIVYRGSVKGVAGMDEQTDPRAKWEFCTQWSVPPAESIDFIAPGFTGWRSHDLEGPYWGRTGRSAGWERTRKGFRNFRLESIYIGAIPVFLALFGVYGAAFRRTRRRAQTGGDVERATEDVKWQADVIFWCAVAVVSLLLSFGKYFPLYRLLYQVPGFSAIRNPNKFLHVFQISVAILAGYGLDLAMSGGTTTQTAIARKSRGFAVAVGALGMVLLLWAAIVSGSRSFQEQRFASDGWGQAAPVIVDNLISSLVHGGVATCLCAAALWVLHMPRLYPKRATRQAVSLGLVMLVTVDLVLLSRHYIRPLSREGAVGENAVTRYLKENLGDQRLLLLGQSGLYNNWLNVLLPYHDITVFNVALMLRMPRSHQTFLATVGRNPVRLWQLASIGYALTPAQIWLGIQQDPILRSIFEPVLGFNVFPARGGLGVCPAPDYRSAQHLVLRFRKGLPKYTAVGGWEVVADQEVCSRLAHPAFDPTESVLVSPDTAEGLPAGRASEGTGTVRVVTMNRRRAVLQTEVQEPSILLAVQKYSPDWRATVNGSAVRLLRCNYLCCGVFLEPGEHEVVFEAAPSLRHLWIQGLGVALCLGAALWILSGATRRADARHGDLRGPPRPARAGKGQEGRAG